MENTNEMTLNSSSEEISLNAGDQSYFEEINVNNIALKQQGSSPSNG